MSPSTPHVVWTHRAEHRLHDFLARAEGAAADRLASMADIQGRLTAAFRDAGDLIVLDLMFGFRPRPGEYILLVDVRQPVRPGTYIVKLAGETRLRRECDAWQACRPPSFQNDIVLMNQEGCAQREAPHGLVALIYQDAGRHIGTDRQIALEEAFLQSVRFDALDAGSVGRALDELFARLGHVLYRGARGEDPAAAFIELNPDETATRCRLADSLARWRTRRSAVETRKQVNAAFPLNFTEFLDPVDFFDFVQHELATGTPAKRWVPRMLRGRAHGDLHGRNVLVGIREHENAVAWPALFDYEHMSRDNLVGWDFVRLETELKIRAYPHVFREAGPPRQYVRRVQELEQQLAEQTEQRRWAGDWPAPGGATPGARLLNLLLLIRGLAGRHLGADRPDEWLEEYYFLLGCYGIETVWFENQSPYERLGTFVSAGVAAARFAYSRRRPLT